MPRSPLSTPTAVAAVVVVEAHSKWIQITMSVERVDIWPIANTAGTRNNYPSPLDEPYKKVTRRDGGDVAQLQR